MGALPPFLKIVFCILKCVNFLVPVDYAINIARSYFDIIKCKVSQKVFRSNENSFVYFLKNRDFN